MFDSSAVRAGRGAGRAPHSAVFVEQSALLCVRKLGEGASTNATALGHAVSRFPSGTHSGLMLANLITFAHFSISLAIRPLKSAGEPGMMVPPRSASWALILGLARPALISRLRVAITLGGVLRGAPMPNQALA